MSTDVILAIDQGTTNSKALLLDQNGRVLSVGSAPVSIEYPQPGWVEQSAETIWASVVAAIQQCTEQTLDANVLAIGISNQRESVVCWDEKSGTALGPVLSWQCRRTADYTDQLKSGGYDTQLLHKTGLPIDPLFPASKIRWLLQQDNNSRARVGTIDSWLIWKLTDGKQISTDRSNASRTQLLDVRTGEWDTDLCALFGVPIDALPTVANSQNHFGVTKNLTGIADGTPITSAIGDSHAALFGHAAFEVGEAKATFGTGSSIMMIVPEFAEPQAGMTATIAWSINNKITYALEGNILVSASLFPWLATMLGLDNDVDKLLELAASVKTSNGVSVVPALSGLGAPHWQPHARGIISGLSFAATPAHIAHAAAQAIPLQVADVFDAMLLQSTSHLKKVFVDGGPTRNKFLMQLLSDLLAQPVYISKDPELSAIGAGLLAGLEIGFWSSTEAIKALDRPREIVEPSLPESDRQSLLSNWHRAIQQCVKAGHH